MRINTASCCLLVLLNVGNIASAQEAPKADNTAQNVGATRKNAVTAEKQRSHKDQVNVLAEIRRSIVAEKGLSMDAKNVKILYSKGIVTLRGPVDSEEEKTVVESVVKRCDAVGAVTNLLTVAAKPH
jgi:hyperosmotically inducible periplasmic protein